MTAATNPQVGAFVFLEGQGPPQKQSYGCIIRQNPGGGGIAAVLVPGRGKPYPAILRGTFIAVPDFRSLIGTIITYVKDGVTVLALVESADLQPNAHWVKDPNSFDSLLMCTGAFSLVPLA